MSAYTASQGRAGWGRAPFAAVAAAALLWSASTGVPVWHDEVQLIEPTVDVRLDDSVYRVPQARWREAFERTMAVLSQREQAALHDMDEDLRVEVGRRFGEPRERVTELADWYYSPRGQAARAGYAVAGLFDTGSPSSARVLESMSAQLFPPDAWAEGQAALAMRLAELGTAHGQRALGEARRSLHAELAPFRVDAPAVDHAVPLAFDVDTRAGSALAETLAADPVLRQQGVALSSAALAGVAARRAAQLGAARAGGRALAAPTGAACAGTGPLAAVCVAGAFAGTLVLSELAVLRLDEARNREAFEAALHAELDRLEDKLTGQLRASVLDGMAESFAKRRSVIDEQVRPIDLILRPGG